MLRRRLLGLVIVLPMLHLTLVGPDEVCVDHGRAVAAAQPNNAAPAHAQSEHAEHHRDSGTHHQNHTSPRCCDAVSSCTITFAASDDAAGSTDLRQIAAVPVVATGRLISRVLGPEPPPPKV
jgi:hypothetical protein